MRRAPAFRDSARYPVVATTVVLATAVSLAGWAGRDLSFLHADPHIRRGELWRLLTSALPHVNVVHLVFNVYWVWAFGTQVEWAFGSLRAAAIFGFLAVVSGGAEWALFSGGVGLSGVGYGLFALLWVLARHDRRFAGAVDPTTTRLFVAWFFLCIATTMLDVMRIGNVAHGVGALAGGLLGFAVARPTGPPRGRRVAAAAATVLLAIASLCGATIARAYVNRSDDRGLAEARLGFEALESRRDEEAVLWLEEATRLAAYDPPAWFNLGLAYQRLGRLRAAAAAYEKAHLLKPDDAAYRAAYEAVR